MRRLYVIPGGMLAFSLFWETISWVVGAKYFPHLLVVIATTFQTFQKQNFWNDLFITIAVFFGSLGLTVVLSILLGATISLNRKFEVVTQDVLAFIRGIPSIVILPLLVAFQGNTISTVVLSVTLISVAKLVVFVVDGFKSVDSNLLDAVAIMKLSKTKKLFTLYLPSGILFSLTSLKLISIVSFTSIIAAGAISGSPGLGNDLHLAEANANINLVFSYVFVMGIGGLLLNWLFTFLERKVEVEL